MAVELREGSLFEPVAGERFDLVVSNPPFVIGAGERFTYRDAGLRADDVGRLLVSAASDHLSDGGWCQLLANWLHVKGEDWRERVARWLPADCDAWVAQREVQDLAEYVEMWLRDSGDDTRPDYIARYDAWLAGLEGLEAEAIGFGWVTLRASRSGSPRVVIEELRQPVEQPVGLALTAWFASGDRLAALSDTALLAETYAVPDDVTLDTVQRGGRGRLACHQPAARAGPWPAAQRPGRRGGGLRGGPLRRAVRHWWRC